MTKINESFWRWVETEMADRHLSFYRIEKNAGLANATISKQARNWTTPTLTACQAIASAFDLPLERVLAKAGYVPEMPKSRLAEFEQLAEILKSLPDGPIRDEAMAAIRAIAEDARRRAHEKREQEKGEKEQDVSRQR